MFVENFLRGPVHDQFQRALEHYELAIDSGKHRERAALGNRRDTDAPPELVEPARGRVSRDLAGDAAAVLPRRRDPIFRSKDVHLFLVRSWPVLVPSFGFE